MDRVRNLEQIQEQDDATRMPRAASLAIVALGGACIVFATLALGSRKPASASAPVDPLGELVAQRTHQARSPAPLRSSRTDLNAQDVTFPSMLSDQKAPTTALAAVRAPSAAATAAVPSTAVDAGRRAAPPPPATAPFERRHGGAAPCAERARGDAGRDAPARRDDEAGERLGPDAGRRSADGPGGARRRLPAPGELVPHRGRGDPVLRPAPRAWSQGLRRRGARAGRGTWCRVRVGPFTTQHAAKAYRTSFEAKEHVVPFVVPPALRDGHEPAAH